MRRLTPLDPTTVYRCLGGEGSWLAVETLPGEKGFVLGAVVPLAEMEPVTSVELGGRLKLTANVIAGTPFARPQAALLNVSTGDTALSMDSCVPETAEDGKLRCLPKATDLLAWADPA